MKSTYSKPKLQTFGDVEVLTQATGASSTDDFVFFNGSPLPSPDGQDDGRYSYFCGADGCTVGPTKR
ncbi:lasso peptide [Lyngbya confervoides]|uniref:Lasso peptide n=1 Tax=Lyngbya confervoides BDU141951 TaxID=1574623 RepID=A0ABD4SZ16_9CYAN|nr:lasso peptide [Lyngbya confervoides]MCM1981401.1 lasso peptide [Lyngbya confervoides BDU141951]